MNGICNLARGRLYVELQTKAIDVPIACIVKLFNMLAPNGTSPQEGVLEMRNCFQVS